MSGVKGLKRELQKMKWRIKNENHNKCKKAVIWKRSTKDIRRQQKGNYWKHSANLYSIHVHIWPKLGCILETRGQVIK